MASVTAVAQAYLYLVRCLRLLNSELGDAMRAIDILLLHCVPSIKLYSNLYPHTT